MNISYNWLKDYLDIDIEVEKLSTILTDIGLEVGGVSEFESIKGGLQGLVIGEVKTCEKHPNADKLSVTTVDIGGDSLLDIVCGAPNVAINQKVVVATVGAVLYDGDDSFKIKKSKIRGAVSEGMICAEDEIGIGTSHDGIIELPQYVKIGINAAEFYNVENDTIFEIDLTPNRVDGSSHYGVARDVAAYLNQEKETVKAKLISVDNFKIDNTNLKINVSVENKEACKRYSGITLENIRIAESPDWLKLKLKSVGLNPINNVVDITNFVLHETGQPLHAFDADKIAGNKIIVKTLSDKTKFITLDEQERELSENDLIICNEDEGMCIAGVFGGADSGVSEKTTKIFLESAYFDSVYVRKTAKRHTLSTDSSFRYERGTDPNMTIYALKRAAMLIKEIAGAKISSEIVDVYPSKVEDFKVSLSYKSLDRLIGKQLDRDLVKIILTALEINILKENSETLELSIPPYRVDVKREADVIEEILRIYGYNNVEISSKVNSTLSYVARPDKEKIQNIISSLLSSNGFNEMMSNSLTKANYYSKYGFNTENTVKILNPLSQDLNAMRQSMLFACLEVVNYNANRRNSDLKLYEFGYTYSLDKQVDTNSVNNYKEEKHLALVLSGYHNQESWKTERTKTDFFNLKLHVEAIIERLGGNLEKIKFDYLSDEIFAEGLTYTFNNKLLVNFGLLKFSLLNDFDIDFDVYYADFNWENVVKVLGIPKINFNELAKFPSSRRDLSLLLDEEISFDKLKNTAQKIEKKLLKEINLFDYYKGNKIENGKKSYAISFVFQDSEKTLNDKQIDKIMNKIQSTFEREYAAKLR
jgi:phenylalanyl-tRNA synthetase beta chain